MRLPRSSFSVSRSPGSGLVTLVRAGLAPSRPRRRSTHPAWTNRPPRRIHRTRLPWWPAYPWSLRHRGRCCWRSTKRPHRPSDSSLCRPARGQLGRSPRRPRNRARPCRHRRRRRRLRVVGPAPNSPRGGADSERGRIGSRLHCASCLDPSQDPCRAPSPRKEAARQMPEDRLSLGQPVLTAVFAANSRSVSRWSRRPRPSARLRRRGGAHRWSSSRGDT